MKLREFYKDFWKMIALAGTRFPTSVAGFALLTILVIIVIHADSTKSKIMEDLFAGTGWLIGASLFLTLLGERLNWRKIWQKIVPAAIAVPAGTLAAICTHNFGEALLWQHIYLSGLAGLILLSFGAIFGEKNRCSLVRHLTIKLALWELFLLMIAGALAVCMAAFRFLIYKFSHEFFGDLFAIFMIFGAGTVSLACVPAKDEAYPLHKILEWIFVALLVPALILLAILYIFLAKMLIEWTVPVDEFLAYAQVATLAYLAFWLAMNDGNVTIFRRILRWIWLALVPIVALEIVKIVEFIGENGLTEDHYWLILLVALEVLAVALIVCQKSLKWLFFAAAGTFIFALLSPWNCLDLPMKNQSARLQNLLEKYDLVADGKFAVPANGVPAISLEDAEEIRATWRQLEGWHRDENYVRKTIYFEPKFARSLGAEMTSRRGIDSLLNLPLKSREITAFSLKESRIAFPQHFVAAHPKQHVNFKQRGGDELEDFEIAGTHFRGNVLEAKIAELRGNAKAASRDEFPLDDAWLELDERFVILVTSFNTWAVSFAAFEKETPVPAADSTGTQESAGTGNAGTQESAGMQN